MKKLFSFCLLTASAVAFSQLYAPGGAVSNSNNGNVGIGTNNPQGKLDIFFNNEQKYMKFYQPDGGNPINSMIASLRYNWYNDVADIGMIRGGVEIL